MTGEPDVLTGAARRAARQFGDRAAFVTPDGWSLSYADLNRAATEIASGLRTRGLGPRSSVILVLGSGVDYVALYLAAVRIGAVTAGVNPASGTIEAAGCLTIVSPDLIVVEPDLAHLVPAGSAPRIEMLAPALGPGAVGGQLRSEEAPGRGLDPGGPGDPDGPICPDHGPICICFTSGSTGEPKAVWFTDHQMRAIAEIDTDGSWGAGGHGLAATSMAHVGFMTKLPWLLARGQTTHLLGRWSAGPALELTARYRMAAVNGVAPQIALMTRHRLIEELDFSAVKAIVAGGAPSPPELVRAARHSFGAPYSIRYSSTESGGVGLATALDADDDEACHSIGRPRPGVRAQIRDGHGSQLPPGRIGELWLRSPTVMSGYWGSPVATAAALVDGWLRTGDLATVDERGLYRLAGRASEMFIRGGYNVYPMEVENVLIEHPGVAEVVVMGRPDPVMGETGLAVVVPGDGAAPPTLEDLRAFATGRLARHKLPEALELVGELPRRPGGKIDRVRLTEEQS